jgi:hypothetical protein
MVVTTLTPRKFETDEEEEAVEDVKMSLWINLQSDNKQASKKE